MKAFARQPRFWIGIAVSLLAIAYAARGVSWSELTAALQRADYRYLVPGVVVIVAGQVARAMRWRSLFSAGGRPSRARAFEILSVGYMVSAVFPFRLGDPLRAWLVETRTRADGAEALATVMVERAIDLLTIVAMVAIILPGTASELLIERLGPGFWSDPAGLGGFVVAMVLVVYVGFLAASAVGPRAAALTTRIVRRLGASEATALSLGAAVDRFARGFACLRDPRTLVAVTGWTIAVWLLGATSNWVFMRAFLPDARYAYAMLVLGTTGLAAILPSSPGYVGVFHSAVVLALLTVGAATADTAFAYAIVLHGVTMLVLILLGVACLWTLGMSGAELTRRLESQEAAG